MDSHELKIKLRNYKLLDKISPEYLDLVIEEIFNVGYNVWIKNFIRNDVVNEINSSNTNLITENKQSSNKGQIGESVVIDILKEKFPDTIVENTSKIPHSGDIQVTLSSKSKIILEVKNYNKTIDQEQIDKLKFDMKFSNIYFAIFISLNSGIVGKKRFEIETFYYNKHNYFIMYIPYSIQKTIPNRKYIITHNSYEESIFNLSIKLEYSLCVLSSLCDNINKKVSFKNKHIPNADFDYIIEQFEKFYEEFRIVKSSAFKLEENIKKTVDSHLMVLKDYEHNIKSNINKLISKKLNNYETTNDKSFVIKSNDLIQMENGQVNFDIYSMNLIVGKIVKIDKFYDLFLIHNKNIYYDFFDDYNECINFLYSI